MKTYRFPSFVVAAALVALAFPTGCATPGQTETAVVQAGGEAGGAYLLSSNLTPGTQTVDPAYLAGYESIVPKVAAVMQGAITPADFRAIVDTIKGSGKLSAAQIAALGFADSVTDSFVKQNGGDSMTPDGAVVALAAGNLAVGLAKSVGLVTGTNWTAPQWVASGTQTTMSVSTLLHH